MSVNALLNVVAGNSINISKGQIKNYFKMYKYFFHKLFKVQGSTFVFLKNKII